MREELVAAHRGRPAVLDIGDGDADGLAIGPGDFVKAGLKRGGAGQGTGPRRAGRGDLDGRGGGLFSDGDRRRGQMAEGRDVLLEIEMQGALQVKRRFPEGVFIFVVPPSMQELKDRIVKRNSETPESLLRRFRSAYEELGYLDEYHYLVLNDDVDRAVERIKAIMLAERCRVSRNEDMRKALLQEVDPT